MFFVADVAFIEWRIVIEVDGMAFHVNPERFQADRTKQSLLSSAGWMVLRLTWSDLIERPDYVIGLIRQAILGRQVG